ncbi:uncharacterized protein MONOS_9118 [Monocercomonoides exilis]|uniref:uncharacterized protein n=1 Tax=Monocercomonoides exilis TaxID=2049356 RepID=UPI00355A23AB|nr:hypothetical protein MONOS_9118 [Monocercomonoides exilis]|eukprot:MONOS_9118.1-p1 / transcript=MONOS_9118.1 / gene=MONOS_9118 / organism=Monocercomonoides_exilis_PA203 / gene_product=unspecified product / transcript_product=unspecified product / location=Mono_scaffold00366:12728-13432(-) / protein_length=199 / sequence_SO=supercontig / SO=protein_coding / is_pseudo=false
MKSSEEMNVTKSLGSTLAKHSRMSVTDEELRLAFELLADGEERLSVETFAQKTKDFHIHNFRELIGESGSITFEELRDFLMNNDRLLSDDPIEQSFRFLDPFNTGYVDMKLLKASLEKSMHSEVTQLEMENIIASTDKDKDGKISLEDFAEMISFFNERPEIELTAGISNATEPQISSMPLIDGSKDPSSPTSAKKDET